MTIQETLGPKGRNNFLELYKEARNLDLGLWGTRLGSYFVHMGFP